MEDDLFTEVAADEGDRLARIILEYERAMCAATILLEHPHRLVTGTHQTTQAKLALWLLRQTLRHTLKPEGG